MTMPPPIRVGDVVIDPPLVLAPMSGISDLAMRRLCREGGAGLVCNEFVSGVALFYGNERTQEYLRFDEIERPVSCQIFGADPDKLAIAARLVEEAGADILDLNLGCAVPKVTKTGAGACLLRTPAAVGRLVRAMVAAVSLPVTVKVRLGWDNGCRNAAAIARIAVAEGAQLVAVHGRTATQGYRGEADWAAIGEIVAAVPEVPVVGNGDVRSGPDAAALLAASGAAGVMIGRGAEGDPGIFGRVAEYLRTGHEPPPPSAAERLALARRHGDLVVEYRGDERAGREMRKHLAWYSHGLYDATTFRTDINKAPDWSTMKQLLDAYGARLAEHGAQLTAQAAAVADGAPPVLVEGYTG